MDGDGDEATQSNVLLAEDDGADVAAAVHAHVNLMMTLRRRAGAGRISRRRGYLGSLPGRRPSKRREFDAGLQASMRDYFGFGGEDPVYDERDFETRFRVPRAVFKRIFQEVKGEPFFERRTNATGKLQSHSLHKVVAAFRVIAYGEAADRADEYVGLSRTVISKCTKNLMLFIVQRWGPTYLRRPTPAELPTILQRNAERGTPGCIGSLDCSHWEWHQCPTGMAGSYQSRKGKSGIVVEAVCDGDLWILHLFVGAPGSLNDINVMQQSPLYLDVTGGRRPPRNHPFNINGTTRTLPYYLVDGIYPRYDVFVSAHPQPTTDQQKVFNGLQEAVHKDFECVFVLLQKRFHVALHPGRYRSVKQLILTYKAVCILQNMCVEHHRENLLSRGRRNGGGAAGEGGTGVGADSGGVGGEHGPGANSGGAVDAGGHGGNGEGSLGGGGDQGGGAHAGGTAAAGGPAPGGGGDSVAEALNAINAAGSPPPALQPVAQPPPGGMAAVSDALVTTRDRGEHQRLRADLTAHVWNDREQLLAPYTR